MDNSNLAARYSALKKSVGGNRERFWYEDTFSRTVEERNAITPVSIWQSRVLSEIEFSIRLSKINGNVFDKYIDEALTLLEKCMADDGTLTNSNCEKAEDLLMPIAKEAKKYSVILAAHAHIDMNWMWAWHETVATTLATFRTMLNIMKEYPDFCFSQSQASVYKIVEDYEPEMMGEIKERIKEGRWEVTASAWVETDKNMPDTQSLINHIKYTKAYLKEKWGIDPKDIEVDFSPDTFGHSTFVPEINNYGNIKYYYHCRVLDGNYALYRWKAPSGREVLVYREQYWYNSGITPAVGIGLIDISQRSGGLKTGLAVYGVGDHGGGPTRRDIEWALEIKKWPVFPELRFGTIREFFKEAESVKDKLPIVDKELNFFAMGCYTTQSRIKMGNRHSESALYAAQLWSAAASAYFNEKYDYRAFEKAWQNVLFTHFHDILTGSCVQDTREHAMGLYSDAMAVAGSRQSRALSMIAQNIDTSQIPCDFDKFSRAEGAGAGFGVEKYTTGRAEERGMGKKRIFHLFNPSYFERYEPVEITVWDWPGDIRYIKMTDASGRELPFQFVEGSKKEYWSHEYFKVLIFLKLPPAGYATFLLDEKEIEEYRFYYQGEVRSSAPTENIVLENEFLRTEFDYKTGEIVSFIDKTSKKEKIRNGVSAGLRCVETEKSTSSAWHIGNYTGMELSPRLRRMRRIFSGELRNGFEAEYEIKGSIIKTEVYLDKNSSGITYDINVDWHEITRENPTVPVLIFKVPVNGEISSYIYDVPAGMQYRKPLDMDVPGLKYGAAADAENRAIILASDCKYGYRGIGNDLILSLINSTYSPDPYPERGIHNISIFLGCEEACPVKIEKRALAFNQKIMSISGTKHSGNLPGSGSFMEFEGESAVIFSVSENMNGKMFIQLYETSENDGKCSISFMRKLKDAVLTDLDGNKIEGYIEVSENSVNIKTRAMGIIGIELTFK